MFKSCGSEIENFTDTEAVAEFPVSPGDFKRNKLEILSQKLFNPKSEVELILS
jgi:hypothetical protein